MDTTMINVKLQLDAFLKHAYKWSFSRGVFLEILLLSMSI